MWSEPHYHWCHTDSVTPVTMVTVTFFLKMCSIKEIKHLRKSVHVIKMINYMNKI